MGNTVLTDYVKYGSNVITKCVCKGCFGWSHIKFFELREVLSKRLCESLFGVGCCNELHLCIQWNTLWTWLQAHFMNVNDSIIHEFVPFYVNVHNWYTYCPVQMCNILSCSSWWMVSSQLMDMLFVFWRSFTQKTHDLCLPKILKLNCLVHMFPNNTSMWLYATPINTNKS